MVIPKDSRMGDSRIDFILLSPILLSFSGSSAFLWGQDI